MRPDQYHHWEHETHHDQAFKFPFNKKHDQVAKKAVRHERLEAKLAVQAIEGLKSTVPEVMMFLGNDVWVERRSEWTEAYGQRMGVQIRDTDSLLGMADQLPTAIVGVGEPEIVGPLVNRLSDEMNGTALVTHSLPMFCEVEALGAGKDLAVEHLATSLKIPRDQVIAVGDGKGDQPMIEWAGLGVGIEGGHPDVVSNADHLIAIPEERGLTNFLEQLLEAGKLGPPGPNPTN